jgi:hypothetical protein
MEAAGSEMFVPIYHTALHHIAEDYRAGTDLRTSNVAYD